MHIQNRLISIENKLVMVTKKETEMGEGQIKRLGSTYAYYYILNGYLIKAFCIA